MDALRQSGEEQPVRMALAAEVPPYQARDRLLVAPPGVSIVAVLASHGHVRTTLRARRKVLDRQVIPVGGDHHVPGHDRKLNISELNRGMPFGHEVISHDAVSPGMQVPSEIARHLGGSKPGARGELGAAEDGALYVDRIQRL